MPEHQNDAAPPADFAHFKISYVLPEFDHYSGTSSIFPAFSLPNDTATPRKW
jgi:hypothetical protein